MGCKRVTIRKEKNRFAKGGVHYVISEGGHRRLVKSTKAEAKKAVIRFRKKRGC
jgi:hypothetical protein